MIPKFDKVWIWKLFMSSFINDGFIKLFIMKEMTVEALQIGEQGGENLMIKFFVKLSYYFVQGMTFEDTTH